MPQPDIICLGEALIDIVPLQPGGSIVASGEMRMAAGGAPANVAVGLAKLGTRVGYLGKVGDDFFGYHLRDILTQNNVDTSHTLFDPVHHTGLAFVNWDAHGDAHYLFYRNPSADTMLSPEDIDPDYVSQAQLLQFGSLMLATEPSAAASYYAIKLARDAGRLLSYDLNLRLTGWPDEAAARAGVSAPLEYANIVKLNRHELAFLVGDSDPDTGTAKLWREHFKLVVITLDKAGCFFRTANATGFVASRPVQAVDTVGAGDGFMAGILDGLRRGNFAFQDQAVVEMACRQAVAVGALTVTKPGGIPAMPTRQEVDAFGL
ncbi:MAG TPA: carbohydrate kinase [Chloroflexia bacterium]|nr:carbohydrate kinase [Chloroflexia bacterium]